MDKVLMNEAREFFKKFKNDTTRKAYEKNYKKYIDFCRRNFNAKRTIAVCTYRSMLTA